uniref:Uncharacterized protein n=1 Tax=Arundo donax TaxID=35708 RepID=A0A0A9ALY4_ARUDO
MGVNFEDDAGAYYKPDLSADPQTDSLTLPIPTLSSSSDPRRSSPPGSTVMRNSVSQPPNGQVHPVSGSTVATLP